MERSSASLRILFIDTEPEVLQGLTNAGYETSDASMGYRTGHREFRFPAPYEVDLIVCDLTRPACFNRRDWGPHGSNDNLNVKILPYEEASNRLILGEGRSRAQPTVVYETQLGPQIPGTFGPHDVNRAIAEGGIPFLLFLNEEWVSRVETFPNWFDAWWSFAIEPAREVHVRDPLASLLPELGTEIEFKLPIQNRIETGPSFKNQGAEQIAREIRIVENNVESAFGQVVRMGRGTAWLLPATQDNVRVIQLFASRLQQVRILALPEPAESFSGPHTIAQGRLMEQEPSAALAFEPPHEKREMTNVRVFISHSHADVCVAEELVNLLRLAIQNFPQDAIRCTSVPGCQLEGGTKTEERLLEELLKADVFIGLLSKQSLQSTYVLFELGARWGARKPLIPLLVAGMNAADLRAPLSSLTALSASSEDQLHDLVVQVASQLGLLLGRTSGYGGHVKKVVRASENQVKKQAVTTV